MHTKVDITNARCLECGKRVEARANISRELSFDDSEKLYNSIYTYWSCKDHGAIYAEVNGEISLRPSNLFDEILFVDWGITANRAIEDFEST